MGILDEKVLATLTEEERETFVDLEIEIDAVNEMQENLLTQMKAALRKKQEIWDVIQDKYGLTGGLTFNRKTGEIKRNKA